MSCVPLTAVGAAANSPPASSFSPLPPTKPCCRDPGAGLRVPAAGSHRLCPQPRLRASFAPSDSCRPFAAPSAAAAALPPARCDPQPRRLGSSGAPAAGAEPPLKAGRAPVWAAAAAAGTPAGNLLNHGPCGCRTDASGLSAGQQRPPTLAGLRPDHPSAVRRGPPAGLGQQEGAARAAQPPPPAVPGPAARSRQRQRQGQLKRQGARLPSPLMLHTLAPCCLLLLISSRRRPACCGLLQCRLLLCVDPPLHR